MPNHPSLTLIAVQFQLRSLISTYNLFPLTSKSYGFFGLESKPFALSFSNVLEKTIVCDFSQIHDDLSLQDLRDCHFTLPIFKTDCEKLGLHTESWWSGLVWYWNWWWWWYSNQTEREFYAIFYR